MESVIRTQLREELVLLERTLWVTFQRDALSRAFAGLSVSANPPVHLAEAAAELSRLTGRSYSGSITQQITLVDSILMERLSVAETDILSYASECMGRIDDAFGKKWAINNESTKTLLSYVKGMLVNYVGIALSEPDMFPVQLPTHDRFSGLQLSAFRLLEFITRHYDPGLFTALLDYWDRENADFKTEVLNELLMQVVSQADQARSDHSTMATLVRTLCVLLQTKDLATRFMSLGNWIVGTKQGNLLEARSALSPFFSPSWFSSTSSSLKSVGVPPPPDPIRDRISDTLSKIRTKGEFNAQCEYFQRTQRELTEALTELVKLLLKANKEPILNWLAEVVMGNSFRTKEGKRLERAQGPNYASDGFCFNVMDVLLALCGPFLDPNDPKAQKIDPGYLLSGTRVKLQNETSICAKSVSEAFPVSSTPYGTISEFYFLCLCMFHYAWHGARTSFLDLIRIINELKKHKEPQYEQEVKYYYKVYQCFDLMLLDRTRNRVLMRFCMLTMSLMTKWSGFDGRHLPLPSPPNLLMRSLPELVVEDIGEFLLLLVETTPDIFTQWTQEECEATTNFITICLSSPTHLTNPYLRAKQVQMLSYMVEGKTAVPAMQGALQWNHLAQMYILEALVQFYVDIEFTGSHNQFYEKFEYRHYATRVFMFLWRYEHYRKQTVEISTSEIFLRFINMLMNDITFLYDESISKLKEVKKHEILLETRALTPEETKVYEQSQSISKYYFQQTNETLEKLEKLTDWSKAVFLKEGFVDRFASMLNYMLNSLNGSKSLDLKVKNPESYNFKPVELLADIIRCYVHLADDKGFLKGVVNDTRSYSMNLMEKTIRILNKRMVVNQEERTKFEKLVGDIRVQAEVAANIEDLLGEIPEEFTCPLTSEMMKNPVKLPSGAVVDRSSIERHLLNDQHDPFNRQPLRIEEVVDDLELKGRIEAWVHSKLAGGQAAFNLDDEEVPDDIACPLTSELMRNPVRLPSGYVVDKSSIERHLLNDPRDPFTKAPLRLEEVVEDEETKRRVQEWVQSKTNPGPS